MAIDVIIGAPGEGKTMEATRRAVSDMKRGFDVYTNWRVETPDKKYCSMMWKKEYAVQYIRNSKIYIDEAWKDYNSNTWKDITQPEHEFFAMCRHYGNDITVITQSDARIATLIKEIGEIHLVKKFKILFWTIGFYIKFYDSLEAFKQRYFAKGEKPYYRHEFHLFSRYVAKSYDTHQNTKLGQMPFIGEKWNKNDEIIASLEKENKILKIENKKIRESINKIDAKVYSVIKKVCRNLQKKLIYFLRWLWKTYRPLRPLMIFIRMRIILPLLDLNVIKRLNDWRVS